MTALRVSTSVHDVLTTMGPARLHVRAVSRPRAVLVLGHGAGRGADTEDLLGLAGSLPSLGTTVVLLDQPWVLAGRRVAAAATSLDVAWVEALAELPRILRGSAGAPIVVGGRSAGARVACRTAATVGASGVLLLAVPLLAPAARADDARREVALAVRLGELGAPVRAGIPVVAAQGERDVFGTAAELAGLVPSVVEVVAVPDADHALRPRRGGPDPAPILLAAAVRAVSRARGETRE